MATIQTATDWRKEWFEIADATHLNTAAHAAIPRVALLGKVGSGTKMSGNLTYQELEAGCRLGEA